MRCLVTGVTGFVGSHLAELLVSEGHEVIGVARSAPVPAERGWEGDAVRVIQADITERAALVDVFRSTRPQIVIHAAAQASVPRSFEDPDGTWRTNVDGTRALYDAVRAACPQVERIVYISTAGIYRSSTQVIPLHEDAPLAPASPYAASKAAADLLSHQHAVNYDMPIVRIRLFNQLGPRQRTGFVAADVACQIARAEAGLQPPEIRVGDLSAVRDFTDVRDMVRAIWAVARRGEPGMVYNAGSGVGRKIEEVVRGLLRHSNADLRLVVEQEKLRKGDPTCLVADTSLLRRTTGWAPQIPFEQSLVDVLNDWRRRVGQVR